MADDETRQCPFCKEQINSAATKCKHCGSRVEPVRLEHGGKCPFCKEAIHPEAVVCKHCKSNLQTSQECSCSHPSQMQMALAGARGGLSVAGGQCQTWCEGSTLICACPVRTPYGQGLLIYPCGTCIDDPVFTA